MKQRNLLIASLLPAFVACTPLTEPEIDNSGTDGVETPGEPEEPGEPGETGEIPFNVRPNILVIMCDQLRWDAVSCYENNPLTRTFHTPNFDRLASWGAYFTHAITPCPVSAPARTSILTGRLIEKTRVIGNGDVKGGDDDSDEENTETITEPLCPYPSYDQVLVQSGYVAEYYGKFHSCSKFAEAYSNPIPDGWGVSSLTGPVSNLVINNAQCYNAYIGESAEALLGVQFVKNGPSPLVTGQQYDGSGIKYWPNPMDLRYGYDPQENPAQRRYPVGSTKKPSTNRMHGTSLMPTTHTTTGFHARNTMAALERLAGQKFALMCSFQSPHPPVIPNQPYVSKYYDTENNTTSTMNRIMAPPSISDGLSGSPYLTSQGSSNDRSDYTNWAKLKYATADYYATVEEVDYWLGQILDKVEALGLKDKTCIFFISDHGEQLGAHGLKGKGVLYEEAIRIPMMMSLPGIVPPGVRIDAPVSEINLFPTIMELLGNTSEQSDGYSLIPLARGGEAKMDFAVAEWQHTKTNVPNICITTKEWKLMLNYSSATYDALYNLASDPYEMNNLMVTDKTSNLEKARELQAKLAGYLEEIEHPYAQQIKERTL